MGGERQRGWWAGAGSSGGGFRACKWCPITARIQDFTAPPPSWELVLSLPTINLSSLKIGLEKSHQNPVEDSCPTHGRSLEALLNELLSMSTGSKTTYNPATSAFSKWDCLGGWS